MNGTHTGRGFEEQAMLLLDQGDRRPHPYKHPSLLWQLVRCFPPPCCCFLLETIDKAAPGPGPGGRDPALSSISALWEAARRKAPWDPLTQAVQ